MCSSDLCPTRATQSAESMARVGHADEHDLAAKPLQRHKELLALNDVAAQVGLTVHDEEGRVDRRRVGDRRAIDVSPDILPRWHATLLGDRPVPSDVARPEVRRDVVDRRLGAGGLEAWGWADAPAGHEPAVADSDHSESLTVDERKTVERLVEAGHEIRKVAATPVADRRATEPLAVALAPARVHVDQRVAGGRLDLGFVPVGVRELAVRTTVDPEQRRVALRGIEGYRLHHPGVDVEPGATEGEALRNRQLDFGAPFAIQIRQLTFTRAVRVAHEQFRGLSGFGGGEGDRSSLLRDREPVDGAVSADDGHR